MERHFLYDSIYFTVLCDRNSFLKRLYKIVSDVALSYFSLFPEYYAEILKLLYDLPFFIIILKGKSGQAKTIRKCFLESSFSLLEVRVLFTFRGLRD